MQVKKKTETDGEIERNNDNKVKNESDGEIERNNDNKVKNEYCIHCLGNLRVQNNLKKVQCRSNRCRKTYSVSTHPLLYSRKLDLGTTLLLIHAVVEGNTFSQIKSFIIINKNTVSAVKQEIEKILT